LFQSEPRYWEWKTTIMKAEIKGERGIRVWEAVAEEKTEGN
jgi:hypothetical protein